MGCNRDESAGASDSRDGGAARGAVWDSAGSVAKDSGLSISACRSARNSAASDSSARLSERDLERRDRGAPGGRYSSRDSVARWQHGGSAAAGEPMGWESASARTSHQAGDTVGAWLRGSARDVKRDVRGSAREVKQEMRGVAQEFRGVADDFRDVAQDLRGVLEDVGSLFGFRRRP